MYTNNNYEEDLDLIAMFLYCLKHWKSIVIIAFLCASIGGVYHVLKRPAEDVNAESRAQAVQQVEICEEKVRKLEEEIATSKIMQIDPDKVFQGIVGYRLNVTADDNLVVMDILTTYTGTELLKELAREVGYTEVELSQMVSLQKGELHTRTISRKAENDDILYESTEEYESFTIQVLGASEGEVEKLLDTAEKCLENYVKQLGMRYGVEGIQRYIYSVSRSASEFISSYQDARNNALNTEKANLETARKSVSSFGEKLDQENGIRNVIVFFGVGAFIVCIFYIGIFVFGDRLYSSCNIEERFGVKYLGDLTDHSNEKGVRRWISIKEGGPYATIPTEQKMKLVLINIHNCLKGKREVERIVLLGSVSEDSIAEELQALSDALKREGYDVVQYQCMWESAEVIEKVQQRDIILLVENLDKSQSSLIDKEIQFWHNYDSAYERIAGMITV